MTRRSCASLLILQTLLLSFDRVTAFVPSISRSSLQSKQQLPIISFRPSASSSTLLRDKLWERLGIEEDEEPMWYLLNCVAGLEMDLLRQCREVCQDMPDAIKFVVPTEKKTRSHGANRMVTETKVKYLGYVFAKLRLCEEVYEAIQSLDLCRSWMGTVNRLGNKKLPPIPLCLDEEEIEKFGLEEMEDEEEEELLEGEMDVIVDTKEENAKDKIDENELKRYLGLKVEDMVKVTAKGKFYNEDGIVRRLKEGKIFVRFYTYGTMFEEWLNPSDVRKLSNEEVLRGLSGPSQPITQFDQPRSQESGYQSDRNRVGTLGNDPRNRRQDRTQERYRGDQENLSELSRDRKNWEWYKTQKDSERGHDASDDTWNMRAGSRRRQEDSTISDEDAQWGRNSPRQRRERKPSRNDRADTGLTEAALDDSSDWSAFVGPSDGLSSGSSDSDDDFFASLMDDLSDSLDSSPSKKKASRKPETKKEDDFFDSLMSELSTDSSTRKIDDDDDFFAALEAEVYEQESKKSPKKSSKPKDDGDDFFAALENDLNDIMSSSDSDRSDTDDFFASLESELEPLFDAPVATKEAAKPKKEKKATPVASSTPPKKEVDLESMTVPDLKEMLRERGLKVSGKKSELIERLQES